MTNDALLPAFLATIQPIVLVGGKSSRFGRDKLREPIGIGGQPLVQRPIDVLRAVFGRRVKLVGRCDASILPLADGIIADDHPDIGPLGGIVSALSRWGGPVFVLAGDMPKISATEIDGILATAIRTPDAWAVLATTDRLHPCVGFYTQRALPTLTARLDARQFQLTNALPSDRIVLVPVSAGAVSNVNTPADITA